MIAAPDWVRLDQEPCQGCHGLSHMRKLLKAKLRSARLERVPWWRSALNRLGPDRHLKHDEALDRLADRTTIDTVREEDVNAWLATFESKSRQRSGNRTDS